MAWHECVRALGKKASERTCHHTLELGGDGKLQRRLEAAGKKKSEVSWPPIK